MLIDVGGQTLNLAFNTCFFAILLVTLLALILWRLLGAARFSYRLRGLFLPVAGDIDWLISVQGMVYADSFGFDAQFEIDIAGKIASF